MEFKTYSFRSQQGIAEIIILLIYNLYFEFKRNVNEKVLVDKFYITFHINNKVETGNINIKEGND